MSEGPVSPEPNSPVRAENTGGDDPTTWRRWLLRSALAAGEATCGAFYTQIDAATWRSTEIEGLFPPLGEAARAACAAASTRAALIATALGGEDLIGATWLREVAEGGAVVVIGDAAHDQRIPAHRDPALTLRSLVAVAVPRAGAAGVLVVANPVHGGGFSADAVSAVRREVARWQAVDAVPR